LPLCFEALPFVAGVRFGRLYWQGSFEVTVGLGRGGFLDMQGFWDGWPMLRQGRDEGAL
jgi:hypothetical protein